MRQLSALLGSPESTACHVQVTGGMAMGKEYTLAVCATGA